MNNLETTPEDSEKMKLLEYAKSKLEAFRKVFQSDSDSFRHVTTHLFDLSTQLMKAGKSWEDVGTSPREMADLIESGLADWTAQIGKKSVELIQLHRKKLENLAKAKRTHGSPDQWNDQNSQIQDSFINIQYEATAMTTKLQILTELLFEINRNPGISPEMVSNIFTGRSRVEESRPIIIAPQLTLRKRILRLFDGLWN